MISHSEKETGKLGRELGKRLKKGDIVALFGELGAGKTVLAKGICEGLGITNGVKSPSFTVIREYIPPKTPDKVYHIDLYRISDPSTILIGEIYEYLQERSAIYIIEWADRIESSLPQDAIKIYLRIIDETGREISVISSSPHVIEK